jgi:Na+-translocating ferredoxin:NAD+ oxidoreductase RnfA subunit
MISLFPAFIVVAIALVVMLTEIVKRLDKKDRLKGYRVYLPLAFSFGAAGLLRVGNFFVPEQMWFWWAVIFGFSVFAFEAILKKIAAALERRDGAPL